MISAAKLVRIVKRTIATIVLASAVIWISDFAILQFRISRGTGLGEVEVHRRLAVHLKNRRIEQNLEPIHEEECVQSLFPHNDDDPCWYLMRHAKDAEDINGAPWRFWNDQ